jgi:sialate O-acetylesterase
VDVDLAGDWKFQINDSSIWKDEDFDDTEWATIDVPEFWEDQGYDEYDGYAWYRKRFDVPAEIIDQRLVMIAGKIDDIDEVYINGELVGRTGRFETESDEPDTYGCWDEFRGYYLPEDFKLKEKGNLVAIRVYDSRGSGGLYEGPVGIITQDNYIKFWKSNKRRFR